MCYIPKLYVLIGLPASGKSSFAKITSNNNTVIISSDAIREEWYGDANIQGDNNKIFSTMQKRTVENLIEKRDVIYDATNITLKSRSFLTNYQPLRDIRKNISVIGVVFAIPFYECCKRNENRARTVPFDVMNRMYRSFTPPLINEGFDKIVIVNDSISDAFDINKKVEGLMGYNQNNPHHLETLGEHLQWCHDKLFETELKDYAELGFYHDIGKPYCETKDTDSVSHYYNHECVSSYITLCNTSLLYGNDYKALYLANLVRWHMTLYSHEFTDKQKALFGEDMIRHLRIFNEIDRVARKR